jgi:hypothetical protein
VEWHCADSVRLSEIDCADLGELHENMNRFVLRARQVKIDVLIVREGKLIVELSAPDMSSGWSISPAARRPRRRLNCDRYRARPWTESGPTNRNTQRDMIMTLEIIIDIRRSFHQHLEDASEYQIIFAWGCGSRCGPAKLQSHRVWQGGLFESF